MKIICPICKEKLIKEDKTYRCINRHSFDIAKEGYLNLNLSSSKSTGDSEEMMNKRHLFLGKNYYAFLREEINRILKEYGIESLVDLGCGEGYYTSFFEVKDKIGVDLSKKGLKIASKNDKHTSYILSSIFRLPLEDNSAQAMTTIFAPVPVEEINRVLKDKGYYILVRPDTNHLYELKEAVYDKAYFNEVEKLNLDNLNLIKEYSISNRVLLDNEDLKELFTMTPYYIKTSPKDKEKLNDIKNLSVSFAFIISVFQKD